MSFLISSLFAVLAVAVLLVAAWIIKGKLSARSLWPRGGNLHFATYSGLLEHAVGMMVRIIKQESGQPQYDLMVSAYAQFSGSPDVCVAYQRMPGSVAALVLSPRDLHYIMIGAGAASGLIRKPDRPYADLEEIGFGAENILTMRNVERHRRMRQLLNPAFSQAAVRAMSVSIFPEHVAKSTSQLRDAAIAATATDKTGTVSVSPLFDALTLDIIAHSAFHRREINNVPIPSAENGPDKAQGTATKKQSISIAGIFNQILDALQFQWRDLIPMGVQKRFPSLNPKRIVAARGFRQLGAAADTIISELKSAQKKQQQQEQQQEENESDDNLEGRPYASLIEAMLDGNRLSAESVSANAVIMLLAGSETSSKTLTYAAMELARHPDVQQQLFEEVADMLALGAAPSDEVAAAMQQLPLLNAVVSETLRLWPPVPMVLRVASEDVTLPASGTTVPKGCIVAICPYAVQRSKVVWGADADQFKPQRWLAAQDSPACRTSRNDRITWLPFLHGSRSCIGSHFALAEICVALGTFVRNVHFAWPDGMPLPKRQQKATMRPNPDLRLVVVPRSE